MTQCTPDRTPYMLTGEWIRRVEQSLIPSADPNGRLSLFNLICEASIKDAWDEAEPWKDKNGEPIKADAPKLWKCSADLVYAGTADSNYPIKIHRYSESAQTNEPPAFGIGTRVIVAYRGFWDIISFPAGHLKGTAQGAITSAGGTVVVGSGDSSRSYTCECPFLRSGDAPITTGTAVAISKNLATGEWEVIQSQCPQD